jgi:hypothetical protein
VEEERRKGKRREGGRRGGRGWRQRGERRRRGERSQRGRGREGEGEERDHTCAPDFIFKTSSTATMKGSFEASAKKGCSKSWTMVHLPS